MNKISEHISQAASLIFHPLLIPTWGFLLLSNSGFYFALVPWSIKKWMLLIIFLFTFLLPALSIVLLSLSSKINVKTGKSTDRILPLLVSSIFYYLGYMILERLPVFPIYNLFLVASVLVIIALIVISLRWKISAHSAAIGALTGGILALSFRLHENPVLILTFLILAGGMVGTARLILLKHTKTEVYTGFTIGFVILNLVVAFI